MAQAAVLRGLVAILLPAVWLGCAGQNDALVATGADAAVDGSLAHADGPVDRTVIQPVDAPPERPMFSAYCYNGDKDPNETDFDCGGNCGPCATGRGCIMASDCVSGPCVSFICAGPASCSNKTKDGKETDVDCGGADCVPCAAGKKCSTATDCSNKSCTSGTCR